MLTKPFRTSFALLWLAAGLWWLYAGWIALSFVGMTASVAGGLILLVCSLLAFMGKRNALFKGVTFLVLVLGLSALLTFSFVAVAVWMVLALYPFRLLAKQMDS